MQKEEEEKIMNNNDGKSGDEAIENQIQSNKLNEGMCELV